jgi:hypothetical protein
MNGSVPSLPTLANEADGARARAIALLLIGRFTNVSSLARWYDAQHRHQRPCEVREGHTKPRWEGGMLAPSTPRRQKVGDAEATPMAFTFPLILASVALALILISAFFFPAVLETPGLESFMVGP